MGHSLQRHIDTRMVHDREHGRKPCTFLADKLGRCSIKNHMAGG